jgi:hypothetical protein
MTGAWTAKKAQYSDAISVIAIHMVFAVHASTDGALQLGGAGSSPHAARLRPWQPPAACAPCVCSQPGAHGACGSGCWQQRMWSSRREQRSGAYVRPGRYGVWQWTTGALPAGCWGRCCKPTMGRARQGSTQQTTACSGVPGQSGRCMWWQSRRLGGKMHCCMSSSCWKAGQRARGCGRHLLQRQK